MSRNRLAMRGDDLFVLLPLMLLLVLLSLFSFDLSRIENKVLCVGRYGGSETNYRRRKYEQNLLSEENFFNKIKRPTTFSHSLPKCLSF